MTQIVVLFPNVEDNYVVGVEQGARYVLTGPDGRRAVFNDSDDPNFVGFLSEPPSGLDGPNIRPSTDDIVQGDGAVHGPFRLGARPFTLTGFIDPTARNDADAQLSLAELVNVRIDRLKRASRGLRSDVRLSWTPAGGLPVMVSGRLAAAPRITDRMPKRFQVQFEASDMRILGQIVRSASGAGSATLTCRNHGNWETFATVTLSGAWTNPVIINAQTGQEFRLTGGSGLVTGSADTLVVDMQAKTVVLNGVTNNYDKVAFPASSWISIDPGDNALSATGGAPAATWRVDWRDSWL
jgi:hypothetical protein